MPRLTVERILRMYLLRRLEQGEDRIGNHQMSDIRSWAQQKFNATHNAGTYERAFRKLKNKVREGNDPHFQEFKEIPQVRKNYSVWRVIPANNQQSLF